MNTSCVDVCNGYRSGQSRRGNKITLSLVAFLAGLAFLASASAQTYTVLHNFTAATGGGPEFPNLLAQGQDGNLYSTASYGGSGGVGVVFRTTPTGTYKVLYNFDNTHGSTPFGGLTLGTDGKFYGTTISGGTSNSGTVFKINSSGSLSSLWSFNVTRDNMYAPYAPPIQGSDGNFYGTAYFGGVYKLTPTGELNQIFWGNQGGSSYGPLFQGVDGNFYGSTVNGGSSLSGSIFNVNAGDIYDFDACSGNPCGPYGSLVQASDGNFYGTTLWGGSLGGGVIFKISPSGAFTALYEFPTDSNGNSCGSDTGLLYATDKKFYGVTSGCGTMGYGVIFKVTPSGAYSVLHNFDKTHGWGADSTLMQHTSGKIYGMTSNGGTGTLGVIFSLDAGLQPFAKLVSTTGRAGQTIGILGQGLRGTTSVKFNGTNATFTVVSDTYLKAKVPSGATSGFVTVTTPSGTLKSSQTFMIP